MLLVVPPRSRPYAARSRGGGAGEREKRPLDDAAVRGTGNAPLAKRQLDKNAAFYAAPEPQLDKEQVCSICLEALDRGGDTSTLHCQHRFHAKCLDSWVGMPRLSEPEQLDAMSAISCPTCREPLLPSISVLVRGVAIEVPWVDHKMTLRSVQTMAISKFMARSPAFMMRFPISSSSTVETFDRRGRRLVGSTLCRHVFPEATVGCKLRVVTGLSIELGRHELQIPHGQFQYGLLLLSRPRGKSSWAEPNGVDAFYQRPADWVQSAVKEHATGACGWSRRRRVLELERELATDAADQTLNDDDVAWAERRRLHVFLAQARRAARFAHEGTRPLDDDVAPNCAELRASAGENSHVGSGSGGGGSHGGTVCETEGHEGVQAGVAVDDELDGDCCTRASLVEVEALLPPRRRRHEAQEILHDSVQRLPLELYGCPFVLEARGALEYIYQLFHECGVLSAADAGNETLVQQLEPLIQTLWIDKTPGAATFDEFREALQEGDEGAWDVVLAPQHDAESVRPIVQVCFELGGAIYILNHEAPETRGKLPSLTYGERVIDLPGVRMTAS